MTDYILILLAYVGIFLYFILAVLILMGSAVFVGILISWGLHFTMTYLPGWVLP